MSTAQEIRRDPSDGELAIVEDVLDVDDAGEENLVVRTKDDEETTTWDEDSFEDAYAEHVLEPGEIWRIHQQCTPSYVGTDVQIVGATLGRIHWRVVRPGPLFDERLRKKWRQLEELEDLSKFLRRFRCVGTSVALVEDIDPYVPTDKDRAAVEEEKKGGGLPGGLGAITELLDALTDDVKKLSLAEFKRGLGISAKVTPPPVGVRLLMGLIGVEVPPEGTPKQEVSTADAKLALHSMRTLVELMSEVGLDLDEEKGDEDKVEALIVKIEAMDAAQPPSATEASKEPWAPGQIRLGDIRSFAATDAAELTLETSTEFRVLEPTAGPLGFGEPGRAPIWRINVRGNTNYRFRESWPNVLVANADGSPAQPPSAPTPPAEDRPARLAPGQRWGWGSGESGVIGHDGFLYHEATGKLVLHGIGTDYRPFDGGIFSTYLGMVETPKKIEVGQRWLVEKDSEGHKRFDILTITNAGEGGIGVQTDRCDEHTHGKLYFTDPNMFGHCTYLGMAEKTTDEEQSTGTQSSEKGTDEMGTTKTTKTSGGPSADDLAKAVAILQGTQEPEFKDVRIQRGGHQVILPDGMTTKRAIKWLQRIDEEDEREVAVHHEIQCYPIEGAYALSRALKEKYGFVSLAATPTFFGPKPPDMVGFNISPTEHVQVPWGRMTVPNVAGHLETGATLKPNGEFRFVLNGVTKRRDEEEINQLVDVVRKFATTQSIYRGQAIRVKFPEGDDFDFTYTPQFIDTAKVREEELVFPADVQEMVNTTLYAPIEKTALCRKLQVPLKRGILLEGPFGVGKTLAAYVTAKKCVDNGWTFMYLDKTADLQQAIQLARNYMPCAIFAEDIDRAVEGEDRSEDMDAILNTIDGIESKSSEIIVVLTTNNVEKINRAMLRPGRLDAVIPVRAPDDAAARQLVINYSCGLLRPGEDLTAVGDALRGMIPASIRETVERSKLAAAARLPEGTDRVELTAHDLIVAARSMTTQLELMKTPLPDERSDIEKAFAQVADALREAAAARAGQAQVDKPNGASHRVLPPEAGTST